MGINNENKFLGQSYEDAWKNYEYTLQNEKAARWDWVVITSSNQNQADAYEKQLKSRMKKGMLPKKLNYLVIPDIEGKRIGSGGATLNSLKWIAEAVGSRDLTKQKILVCHSGGDSKRIPQYSACGKLFSPVPRVLPNGQRSTLFDELLIAVSGIPARIQGGMLVLPGDTEVLFNPLQLDLEAHDAAGLSIKTHLSEGKEHGVFVGGKEGVVKHFLHKQTEEILRTYQAVDERDSVDLDTGCIWFGKKVVGAIYQLICEDGRFHQPLFDQLVNETVCLSIYSDFLYPMAEDSRREAYFLEKPEREYSELLTRCRTKIWDALSPFQLSLIRMSPAQYIHFGTTNELFHMMTEGVLEYGYLGWGKKVLCNSVYSADFSGNNSYLKESVTVMGKAYLEDSILLDGVTLEENTILSGIEAENCTIPGGMAFHTMKLKNGKYVCRVYGIEDNPKGSIDSQFLDTTLRNIIDRLNVPYEKIWDHLPASIWNAKLYLEAPGRKEALGQTLRLLAIIKGAASEEEITEWLSAKRYSLQEGFELADVEEILEWQDHIEHLVRVENGIAEIKKGRDIKAVTAKFLSGDKEEERLLEERAKEEADLFLKIRLYLALYYLGEGDRNYHSFEDTAYQLIKDSITREVWKRHPAGDKIQFQEDKVSIDMPVRVNFCGSPSDAAPYCLEHGGTMLDGTLLLKGERPIHVEIHRLDNPVVLLESVDGGIRAEYTQMEELLNCGDLYDPFALPKAVFQATGLLPENSWELSVQEWCQRLGGGLYLRSDVRIPKGSGLGTSSLLAAAEIQAVHRIMGIDVSDKAVYAMVFAAEQLMNTGGGWQDQVGGMTDGIKFMQSLPGIYQDIKVETLDLSPEIKSELQERFALIFSGQRRLAKNVLREEMNQCIRNNPKALEAIEQIRKLCVLMKYELERGNVTAFAHYISEQFELVKLLDQGASNTCIEYIFDICEDLLDGKSICGAGGGGFLQVILKKGVSKQQLEERIREAFRGCGVEVWDCTLI